jgi:DNA-binding response OmpR family regulator
MTKILVAEDEPDIRELVSLSLQFAGFEVVTVNNGAELIERAPVVMPDMILTDVRMPKMTGYEACRALKGNPKTVDIPIVFLSAKGQEEEVKAGLTAGGEAYILKPFAPDQLARRVRELLEENTKRHSTDKDARESNEKPIPPAPQIVTPSPAVPILHDPKKGTKPLGPLPDLPAKQSPEPAPPSAAAPPAASKP